MDRGHLTCLLLASVLTIAPASPARGEKAPTFRFRSGALAEVPFPRSVNALFVPVRIGEVEGLFLLETGSSRTFIDNSIADHLGEPIDVGEVRQQDRVVTIKRFLIDGVAVGKAVAPGPIRLSSYDFDAVRQVVGRDIRGILGMDFLKSFVVRLDFDTGRIVIDQTLPGEPETWGTAFPIAYDARQRPTVAAELDGVGKVAFLIDTGASDTGTLASLHFDPIQQQPGASQASVSYLTAAGFVRNRLCRVPALQWGPFRHENLVFAEHEGGAKGTSALGLAFLSRYVVTFDFPKNVMYVRASSRHDLPDETDMSGLRLLRREARTVVGSVEAEGVAAQAGIQSDDELIAIEGRDIAQFEMWEIKSLLQSGDQRPIRLRYRRGDATHDVTLVLRRQL